MKLRELEKRLDKEPTNLGLRVQVAGLMREAGRSVEAVELYRSVALAYRDQGRVQQAIAVCRSILDIAPDDAACQGLLAMMQSAPATARTAPMPSQLPPTARTEPMPSQPPPTREPLPEPPGPPRRSSMEDTPLPRAVPHHVYDPTSAKYRVSASEVDLPVSEGADTRPGGEPPRPSLTGLAEAARRISGLITDTRGVPREMDLSAELDTRQRPKIPTDQLEKLDEVTVPGADVVASRDSDLVTEPITTVPLGERASDEEMTVPRDKPKLFDDD